MTSPGASWSLRFDLPATFTVSGVQRSSSPAVIAVKGVVLGDVKTWEDGAPAGLTYSLAAPGDMSFRSWNIVIVRDNLLDRAPKKKSPVN